MKRADAAMLASIPRAERAGRRVGCAMDHGAQATANRH